MKQERLLTAHSQNTQATDSIGDKISKKTKKNKEDLLINKVDYFRMKKQVLDVIDSKTPLNEKYGDRSW